MITRSQTRNRAAVAVPAAKVKSPKIYNYLEKYIYQPKRAKKFVSYDRRLDMALKKCELLEAEVADYKQKYGSESSAPNVGEEDVDAAAAQMLEGLLLQCGSFESELKELSKADPVKDETAEVAKAEHKSVVKDQTTLFQ